MENGEFSHFQNNCRESGSNGCDSCKQFPDVRTIVRLDGISVMVCGPVSPAEILPFLDKEKTLFYCKKCINYGKQ